MTIRTKLFLNDFIKSISIIILFVLVRQSRNLVSVFFSNASTIMCIESVHNLVMILILLFYIMHWYIFVSNSIQDHSICRFLKLSAYIMIFWFLCRSIKFYCVNSSDFLYRYLWYLYYLGMMFIPLLCLGAVLYIDRNQSRNCFFIFHIFALITTVLFAGVITNEYHHLMFRFNPAEFVVKGNYSYGPLYFIILIWILFMAGLMLAIAFYKSSYMVSKTKLWIPLSYIIFLLLYCFVYSNFHFNGIQLTEMFIWSYIGIMKSLIFTGLISSNFLHSSIFNQSTINAVILDQDDHIRYQSNPVSSLTSEMMEGLKNREESLDERTVIKQASIHGGSVAWLEDVSSINIIIQKLQEVQVKIAENNDLLRAEVSLKEKEEQVRTQTILYDSILSDLNASIKELEYLLDKENPDFLKICLIGSYLKRTCNLIVLEQDHTQVSSREFDYCMKELLDTLRAVHVDCTFVNRQRDAMEVRQIKHLYDISYEIIMTAYSEIHSLFIRYDGTNSGQIRFMIGAEQDLSNRYDPNKYKLSFEDSTLFITYTER